MMIIERMSLIGCDNIQYCSNNLVIFAHSDLSKTNYTNMKTVFANKCSFVSNRMALQMMKNSFPLQLPVFTTSHLRNQMILRRKDNFLV